MLHIASYQQPYTQLVKLCFQNMNSTCVYRIFSQNNTESQIISLVSTFSKQFSKLTSQAKGTRFCCGKSSVIKLSSMELKSSRLDFPEISNGTSSNQRPKLNKTSSNPFLEKKMNDPKKNEWPREENEGIRGKPSPGASSPPLEP